MTNIEIVCLSYLYMYKPLLVNLFSESVNLLTFKLQRTNMALFYSNI